MMNKINQPKELKDFTDEEFNEEFERRWARDETKKLFEKLGKKIKDKTIWIKDGTKNLCFSDADYLYSLDLVTGNGRKEKKNQ